MNKAEFVADVSERIGESKQRGEEVVNAVFEALTAALKRGEEVAGVFCAPEKPGAKADPLRAAAEEKSPQETSREP